MLFWLAAPALAAQSPFGVGLPEQAGGPGGLIPWIATLQKQFYRELTDALKALRESGQAFWWLAGLSFAYGVVHAAGPGHGKVVISSYLLANEESARRGILIAFLAAMVQAVTAVAIFGVIAILLNMTSMAMTETAKAFELGSYGLIAALGLYLLYRKARGLFRARSSHAHSHVHGPDCGHTHAPTPEVAARVRGLGGALAAIFSVGIRPCSGALIVLAFALAQGIFWAGVASTFLMGVGTALTIATLAVTAVYAKGFATRLAGAGSNRAAILMNGVEIAGALFITAFGFLLLAGALSG
jgi:ABC-type nickel/cobalt efflux system permease component RcnA